MINRLKFDANMQKDQAVSESAKQFPAPLEQELHSSVEGSR